MVDRPGDRAPATAAARSSRRGAGDGDGPPRTCCRGRRHRDRPGGRLRCGRSRDDGPASPHLLTAPGAPRRLLAPAGGPRPADRPRRAGPARSPTSAHPGDDGPASRPRSASAPADGPASRPRSAPPPADGPGGPPWIGRRAPRRCDGCRRHGREQPPDPAGCPRSARHRDGGHASSRSHGHRFRADRPGHPAGAPPVGRPGHHAVPTFRLPRDGRPCRSPSPRRRADPLDRSGRLRHRRHGVRLRHPSGPLRPRGDPAGRPGSGALGRRRPDRPGGHALLVLVGEMSCRRGYLGAAGGTPASATDGMPETHEDGGRSHWLRPPSRMVVRRRPTLPPRLQGSTIGAERLSFRVRNGSGRFPLAMAAVTL